jgi:hypothetical protein
MTATNRLEVLEFACLMAREFPKVHGLPGLLDDLMKLAKRHGKLAERECNVGDVSDKTWERLEAKIRAICEEIGCGVKLGGDPRGYTVKVIVPSGRYNTWGGAEEGWGVPQ